MRIRNKKKFVISITVVLTIIAIVLSVVQLTRFGEDKKQTFAVALKSEDEEKSVEKIKGEKLVTAENDMWGDYGFRETYGNGDFDYEGRFVLNCHIEVEQPGMQYVHTDDAIIYCIDNRRLSAFSDTNQVELRWKYTEAGFSNYEIFVRMNVPEEGARKRVL